MSKKLFALVLLAAVGSASAGAKFDKVKGWVSTAGGSAKDFVTVVLKPTFKCTDESTAQDSCKSFKPGLGWLQIQKLSKYWVAYPHDAALVAATAFGLYKLKNPATKAYRKFRKLDVDKEVVAS